MKFLALLLALFVFALCYCCADASAHGGLAVRSITRQRIFAPRVIVQRQRFVSPVVVQQQLVAPVYAAPLFVQPQAVVVPQCAPQALIVPY